MNSLPLLVMRALLASRLGAAPLEVQTSKAAETGTFRLGYSSVLFVLKQMLKRVLENHHCRKQ